MLAHGSMAQCQNMSTNMSTNMVKHATMSALRVFGGGSYALVCAG